MLSEPTSNVLAKELYCKVKQEEEKPVVLQRSRTSTSHNENGNSQSFDGKPTTTAATISALTTNDAVGTISTTITATATNDAIYRLGHSDTFACHNCKNKGDKWFMQQHDCRRKK